MLNLNWQKHVRGIRGVIVGRSADGTTGAGILSGVVLVSKSVGWESKIYSVWFVFSEASNK